MSIVLDNFRIDTFRIPRSTFFSELSRFLWIQLSNDRIQRVWLVGFRAEGGQVWTREEGGTRREVERPSSEGFRDANVSYVSYFFPHSGVQASIDNVDVCRPVLPQQVELKTPVQIDKDGKVVPPPKPKSSVSVPLFFLSAREMDD